MYRLYLLLICVCVLVLVYQTSLISSAPGVQETLLYVVLQSHTISTVHAHISMYRLYLLLICVCVLVLVYQTSLISSAPGVQETLLYVVLQSHTISTVHAHISMYRLYLLLICVCVLVLVYQTSLISSAPGVQETLLYVVLQSHTISTVHAHISMYRLYLLLICVCVLVLVYQTSLISSAPGVQETLLYVVLQSHRSKTLSAPAFPNRITHDFEQLSRIMKSWRNPIERIRTGKNS